jgi:type II secretory pathway pseudopilin PulG
VRSQAEPGNERSRRGFTLTELTIAFALTTIAIGMVVALAFWAFNDRAQRQARFRALEAANNVLETARSLPWEQLSAGWAESQKMSDDPEIPEGRVQVKVENDADTPVLKRVTVRVEWLTNAARPPASVELVGFFAAKDERVRGGTP